MPSYDGGLEAQLMKEKYTKNINVRFTESECKRLKKKAAPFGSISKYCRAILISNEKKLVDREALKVMTELSVQISRVGNNINQIARFMNTTKDWQNIKLMEEWFDTFDSYMALLEKVNSNFDDFFTK